MTPTTWIGQQWAWLQCVPPAGGSLKETLEDWLPAETDVAVASVVRLERSRASAAFRPGLLWGTWQNCPEAAVRDSSLSGSGPSRLGPLRTGWLQQSLAYLGVTPVSASSSQGFTWLPLRASPPPSFQNTPNMMTSVKTLYLSKALCAGLGQDLGPPGGHVGPLHMLATP